MLKEYNQEVHPVYSVSARACGRGHQSPNLHSSYFFKVRPAESEKHTIKLVSPDLRKALTCLDL